ncbi:hypothetical protein HDU82_002927, partial [Entophlyctis luteolus]
MIARLGSLAGELGDGLEQAVPSGALLVPRVLVDRTHRGHLVQGQISANNNTTAAAAAATVAAASSALGNAAREVTDAVFDSHVAAWRACHVRLASADGSVWQTHINPVVVLRVVE